MALPQEVLFLRNSQEWINLNDHDTVVKFSFFIKLAFIFKRDRSDIATSFISLIRAQRFMKKGCQAILAMVRDLDENVPDLSRVPIVSKFPYVFLKELLGLLLDREVELCIDVIFGTQPIFILPYWMASTKT